MQFKNLIQPVLSQLSVTLLQLTDEQYSKRCNQLNGSTIGGHTRHIIELFQCLLNGYDAGIVNYEKRKRDTLIETNKQLAGDLLYQIGNISNLPNKQMNLQCTLGDNNTELENIETNFYREMMYNLEHTIHHMALIRVGINEVSKINVPVNFGVAASTIQYNKVCVQ